MREAGLTRTRIEGTRRFIALRREDLDARFPGLLDAVVTASRSRAAASRSSGLSRASTSSSAASTAACTGSVLPFTRNGSIGSCSNRAAERSSVQSQSLAVASTGRAAGPV